MKERPFHYDPPAARDHDLELPIQAGMLERLMIGFPEVQVTAVPNGQKRTRWQAQQAKAEGMSAGFPDLIIMAASECASGTFGAPPLVAFVEVKAEAPLTGEQEAWLTWMAAAGFHCGVFRSQETLARKLKEWGFPHRERN